MVVIAGMALPILYLNCEGNFKGKQQSDFSSQCISRTTENMAVQSVNYPEVEVRGPSKLLLSHNPFEQQGQQKLNIQVDVPFAIMLDPKCVAAYVAEPNTPPPPSQVITEGKRLETSISRQTFPWTVNSQVELDQFELDINGDVCVIAAGLDHQYELQSVAPAQLDDPQINQQGHLEALNFQAAYSVFYHEEKGVQNLKQADNSIVVAVIDTGVAYTHTDLTNNMWKMNDQYPYAGVNATTVGTPGVETDFDPFDTAPNSHGTHVAGIIAAEADNAVGGTGLAPSGVNIMGIRIFNTKENSSDDIISTTVDVVAGIYWAVDHGADILNLSLARIVDGNKDQAVRDEVLELAIKYALQKNVFVVFAAGNGNFNYPAQEITDSAFSVLPGRYGSEFLGAVTVGSFDATTLERSSFSHFSAKFVEIAAPGQEFDGNGADAAGGIYSTASPVLWII